MKHGAFTFAFLLLAGTAGSVAFVGCSSDPETPATAADTGTADTGTPDTKVPDTTPAVDTGPVTCAAPLDATFKCEAPPGKAGKTVCSDIAINDLVGGCFGSTATSATCTAAQKKHPDCNTCMLTEWVYGDPPIFIDTGSCIKAIDPADKCATTWKCNVDCFTTVCVDCDNSAGSGKNGVDSEQDDCWANAQKKGGTTVPKGACYDLVTKDYAACRSNPKFAYCFVSGTEAIKQFYRGACRDGGKWTAEVEIDKSPVSDAGADTATDPGAADTGGAADTSVLPDVALDLGLPG